MYHLCLQNFGIRKGMREIEGSVIQSKDVYLSDSAVWSLCFLSEEFQSKSWGLNYSEWFTDLITFLLLPPSHLLFVAERSLGSEHIRRWDFQGSWSCRRANFRCMLFLDTDGLHRSCSQVSSAYSFA